MSETKAVKDESGVAQRSAAQRSELQPVVMCECGRGRIVTLKNGEKNCSFTLDRFFLSNGYRYEEAVNALQKCV